GGVVSLILSDITLTSGIWPEVGREKVIIPIYSLRNDSSISGSFFLGSGSIDSTEYYYTFYKDKRGGYHRWKIPNYEATLFMDSNEPHAYYEKVTYECPWWISLPFKNTKSTKIDLHVPKGTIIEKF